MAMGELDPQAAADSRIFVRRKSAEKNLASRIRSRILSAEKYMDIRIIKWNQNCNKWLACYLKRIILVISTLFVITDGRRFSNSKETDNNNKYITHVGNHFSLGLTDQTKLFVISWILAANFFVISRILAEFFMPAVDIFFRLQIGGLGRTGCNGWPLVSRTACIIRYKSDVFVVFQNL